MGKAREAEAKGRIMAERETSNHRVEEEDMRIATKKQRKEGNSKEQLGANEKRMRGKTRDVK